MTLFLMCMPKLSRWCQSSKCTEDQMTKPLKAVADQVMTEDMYSFFFLVVSLSVNMLYANAGERRWYYAEGETLVCSYCIIPGDCSLVTVYFLG